MHKKNALLSRCVGIVACAITLTVFAACSAGGDDGDDDTSAGAGELDLEISASTDSRGRASISFTSAESVTKLAVSAFSSGNDIRFTNFDGGGNDYLSPGGEVISLAEDTTPNVVAVNAPSRDSDPSFASQSRFNVSVETSGGESEEVVFRVTSRRDGNLSSGSLRLNVFYVGSVGAERTTKDAVKQALDQARSIMSGAAGINLQVAEYDIGGPVTLPSPIDGGDLYASASASAPAPSVNVFIGGDIAGTAGPGEVLGLSAGIPGAPTPSVKSGVAIGIFSGAGRDGIFSGEDIRILGETIAHESAHYMGLFHPVDFSGSVVFASDPLPDTEGCSFLTDCVSRDNLIRNLMFATPITDGNGGFVTQNRLTSNQRAVLNRYAAVD